MNHPIVCPSCRTRNGSVAVNENLLLVLFVQVACSACRSRVTIANDTPINQHNASAMELKHVQDESRQLRSENHRLEQELGAARERIEEMQAHAELAS